MLFPGLADDEIPSRPITSLRLEEFERQYPRKAEGVTLTFFGGLTTGEVAEVLGLSTRTVERDWLFAKAWLNRRLARMEAGE